MREVRSFLYIAIAAVVLLGPLPRQVFGVRDWPIPGWVMFRGKNLNVCSGQLYRVTGETLSRTMLEEVLGRPLSRGDRRVKKENLKTFIHRLCKARESEGLRAEIQCADRKSGWHQEIAKESLLCSEIDAPTGPSKINTKLRKALR